MNRIPPITKIIIIANFVVFLLAPFLGSDLISVFALWPLGPQFHLWQIISYAFLHGNFMHILFNMFALYMFGGEMESVWGKRRYLTYYFVCVVSAGLTQLAVSSLSGIYYPTIGASGAVFGLLLAFAIYFPERQIMLLFPPIPLPAKIFVILYAALELVLGVTGTQEGVAHFAHLGGLAGGYLLLRFWKVRR
ncbi:MAG: rhomboid family intramembrane serine protease [Bdellovibrio sp.]